jgi:natural product precursor
MRQNRSLSLKRETLSELTPAEMTAVNGGTHVGCGVTANCTHASFDSCPTVPLNQCLTPLIADTFTCA